jgi:hypothetical protein
MGIRLLLSNKYRQAEGKSGLVLDAQRAAVAMYLNGGSWQIVDEFTEVESGKRPDKPAELQPSRCHRRAQIQMGRPGRKDQAASIGGLVEVL